MRIYAELRPDMLPAPGRQWCMARGLVDPTTAVLTYVVAVLLFEEDWLATDSVLLIAAFLLLYPGRVAFHRFSVAVAMQLLLACAAVALLFAVARWTQAGFSSDALADLEWSAGTAWVAALPFVMLGLHALSAKLAPLLRWFYQDTRVVVVGVSSASVRLAEAIRAGQAEGQRLVACFEDRSSTRTPIPATMNVVGGLADVAAYVRQNAVGIIYIALPMTPQPRVLTLLDALKDTTASVCFIPDIFITDLIQGRVESMAGVPVLSLWDTPFRGTQGAVKRAVDLVVTTCALPIALPLMLAIGLAIRLTSPGPVIFKQRRYGLDGRQILVWKFRTMRITEDGDTSYRQVTRDDDRVTALGRFLRANSLDELPQLLNVLGGSMSLVGPRPHALAVNEQYRKLIPGYMLRHKVRPGITGWAQVNGQRGGNDLESMRKRTELDLAYLRLWSLSFDLLILLLTARMLVAGDSKAY